MPKGSQTSPNVVKHRAIGRLAMVLLSVALCAGQAGCVGRATAPTPRATVPTPRAPSAVPSAGAESPSSTNASTSAPTTAMTEPPTRAPSAVPEEPDGPALSPSASELAYLQGPWTSIFADEFEGDTLDRRSWTPNWLADDEEAVTKPVNRSELSCYDPAQVSVRGGSARLKVAERACTDNRGKKYSYASGLIQSAGKFEFSYGYAEARLFLSPGAGNNCGPNWPAFWLNGEDPERDGEIDVMECLSRNNVAWHYHTAQVNSGANPPSWDGTMPVTDGWHTFAVYWQRGSLDFFYDGVHVGSQTNGVMGAPHYLIVNLATSGDEVKEEILHVDYVRVWRRV